MNEFEKKIEKAKEIIKVHDKVLVAFSGGKDSFFLLKLALDALGKEKVTAVSVKSGFTTQNDEKRVDYFTGKLDFKLERVFIDISGEEDVMKNLKGRCYFCKKKIFATLKSLAVREGIKTVVDGTTHSDLSEFRPGLVALTELAIVSPLQEAGITSAEIVKYLREELHIDEYYLTSSTCLATRFPYEFELTDSLLKTYDELETFFVEMEIYPVKVRYIPNGIRIETPEKHFSKFFSEKEKIIKFCKERGIKFVTLDIEGIKSGVWD
ncbi:MAG: ATP-dependent sacrificial sulfur transferase LarE [bacterium]|nr:ATP-dependent sacrificial sulfur transferase LarE [bacterium]